MSKSNSKVNKPMLFAGILLCLCILSVYFMNGLYARYYSRVSGDDSARVAKFEVSESGSLTGSFAIEVSPEQSVTKEIQVVSDSEVTVSYTLTAESLQHLPLQFTWDDGEAQEVATITSEISATEPGTKSHSLKVSWSQDAGKNNYLYSYELDYIIVTIDYEQVD